ncbi:MAG: ImmA/IrrE family metallo-endopeptidase, partial [Stellaceae bacterium]
MIEEEGKQSRVIWTNPSVRAFAGDKNPVAAMERKARSVILEAFDKGWSGPPFDPITLADILKIHVQPQTDVVDARTIPTSTGGLTIEFNPRQPRERLRFSIAHEIAHTFFPDCAKAVRHRGGRDHSRSDDWQLEMLCNIAAAEIVMPFGDVSQISSGSLTIERIMELRSRFDVSAEAMLIRVAKATDERVAMFCASRTDGAKSDRFRLDYSIASRAFTEALPSGLVIGPETVLKECTAIGFTAHRVERWPGAAADLEIQCVGLSPYPGTRYPRIAGLARQQKGPKTSNSALTYLHGDALDPRGTGLRLICHVVNDGAVVWGGGGFAAAARHRYPIAQEDFRNWIQRADGRPRLGSVRFCDVGDSLRLASMVAQKGYGPSGGPRIRYTALEQCLERVAEEA